MAGSVVDRHEGYVERFRSSVCRRAFSSPEAFSYEFSVGPAVLSVAAPLVDEIAFRGSVLDVGSGGGRLAAHLAASGSSVICLDPSSAQARRSNRLRRHGYRLAAVQGKAGELPFANTTFDGVVSCCALKHWPDPVNGLRECARVLRPGGTLLLIEIEGSSTPAALARFTRLTRIPLGLRAAYVRFAMRTVVAVAPTLERLQSYLRDADLEPDALGCVSGLPFCMATVRLNPK